MTGTFLEIGLVADMRPGPGRRYRPLGPGRRPSAGLEVRGDAALLRSLAVAADVRGTGLGAAVLRRALREADHRKDGVYALTTTAEQYLSRFGFERVPRTSLPPELFESRELQDACPASATVMKRERGAR